MPTFSPVWPGPGLLVPLTVDALLVGEPNRVPDALWAQTGVAYAGLSRLSPAVVPFAAHSGSSIPGVGVHLLWTLPSALRRGHQIPEGPDAGAVEFPFVPNRWAILRSHTPVDADGEPLPQPPSLKAGILISDATPPPTQGGSLYPKDGGVTGLGQYVPLDTWTGTATPPFLRAAGPGDVSWSAAYDNVRNVLAFHDDLSDLPPGRCSFHVAGWYSDPSLDPLGAWQRPDDWFALLRRFGWGLGDDGEHALPRGAIASARAAWHRWERAHGLSAGTFDPARIDPTTVPGPLSILARRWGTYFAAHGTPTVSPEKLSLPAQTLCHGAVLGLHWKGANFGYPSGAPAAGPEAVSVGVGNTAVEAIGAWLADRIRQDGSSDEAADIENALAAFQKGWIHDLERNPVETHAALHQGRFGREAGGWRWTVVRPEQKSAASLAGVTDRPNGGYADPGMPLSAEPTDALRALNRAQKEADAANRQIAALDGELWALYSKRWFLMATHAPDPEDRIQTAIEALVGEAAVRRTGPIAGWLGQALSIRTRRLADVETARTQLQSLLSATPETAGFRIEKVNSPGFSHPVDPVVVVAGARADTKHAAPGTFGGDGFLYARFTGQTLTSITIDDGTPGVAAVALEVADLASSVSLPGIATPETGLGIPKELPDLWLEMLLVDPSCRSWLAQAYLAKFRSRTGTAAPWSAAQVADAIHVRQTALLNDAGSLGIARSTLAAAAQFQGLPPSPIALEDGSVPPWSPLYLDWEVTWCPSPAATSGFPADWTLEGLDFAWNGSDIAAPTARFSGRTTLDPLTSRSLAAQIERFVDTDADLGSLPVSIVDDLRALASTIAGFDFVTQSLSGLTDRWLTRASAPNGAVPASCFSPQTHPDVRAHVRAGQSFQPVLQTADLTPPPYDPIRAGHFRLSRLWVVDAFGQVLTPLRHGENFVPVKTAASVTPPATLASDGYVQLPPRLTQPARLGLTWIQADDDARESNASDATSPICGWVMANHLDDSLMVFDAVGTCQGAILALARDAGQTGLRWDAAPGQPVALGSGPHLSNRHLQGLVGAVLAAGAAGTDAFRDLLDVLDASAWQTSPRSQTAQKDLAVLVGRPLAVVRLRIDLELFGDPFLAFDQDLRKTGNAYPPQPLPPFSRVAFPVRLGDDAFPSNGVCGYFLGDDYSHMFAASPTPRVTAALRRDFAGARDPSASIAALAALPDSGSHLTSKPGYVAPRVPFPVAAKTLRNGSLVSGQVFVTAIVDPSGRIPLVSGAFPVVYADLPVGPVHTALERMTLSFRAGPVLVDPASIRMPLPSEIHGDWSWLSRQSVTLWGPAVEVGTADDVPVLADVPLRLREGWLVLRPPKPSETR